MFFVFFVGTFNRRQDDQGCDHNGLKFQFLISRGLQKAVIPSTFHWLARIVESTYNIHLHSFRNRYKWIVHGVFLCKSRTWFFSHATLERRHGNMSRAAQRCLPLARSHTARHIHSEGRRKLQTALCVICLQRAWAVFGVVMIFFFFLPEVTPVSYNLVQRCCNCILLVLKDMHTQHECYSHLSLSHTSARNLPSQ